MRNLSVVVPCYNEEKTILEILRKILAQKMVGEIIVIDDFSSDQSVSKIKSITDKRVKLIRNSSNRGKGYCVSEGFKNAKFEYIIIQDADLEYDPNEYKKLMSPLIEGKADAVFGSRFLTSSSRRVLYYWHRLGNNFLTQFSNIFTNIDLTDMETCYKVMKSDVAKSLKIQEKRFGLEPEITAKMAAMRIRIFEVPISYNGRTYDEGKKITWKDGFRAIWCILKYNNFIEKRRQFEEYQRVLSKESIN